MAPVQMDEATFQRILSRVGPSVTKIILDEQITKSEWQNLYHDVYSICLWDERGCAKLLKFLETNYMKLFIRKSKLIIFEKRCPNDYGTYWNQLKVHTERLPMVFQQLDLAAKKPTVKSLLLKLWDQHIAADLYEQLIDCVIDRANRAKEQQIAALRESFRWLDENNSGRSNYMQELENKYLYETELFIAAKSVEIPRDSITDQEYIDWAICEILEEKMRALSLLAGDSVSTIQKVTEICCQIFFTVRFQSRFPELLASYCDQLLRIRSLRKLTPEDVDTRLLQVLSIIKFIPDKETFLKSHKALLTRRLIQNVTSNIYKEESFSLELKKIESMPQEVILKLEKMFNDLNVSRELQEEYKLQNCENNNLESQETTSVRILTQTAWSKPSETNSVKLPSDIKSFRPSFEAFYTNSFPGRKLDWCDQLSYGTITFYSNHGEYDLDVTAAQLSVIEAYNEHRDASYSIEELEKLTGLNQSQLHKTLWSLLSNPRVKLQLLKCEPPVSSFKEMELSGASRYSVNQDFALIKNDKLLPKGRACLLGRLQV